MLQVVKNDPLLKLVCMGKCALLSGDEEVRLASRKTQAFLAYLTTRPTRKESRERLAGLFWGNNTEDNARTSLRQMLARLRLSLPEEYADIIYADRLDIGFDPSMLVSDHQEILASLDRGILPEVLLNERRFADSFLQGFDDIDPGFRTWLLIQRQQFHDTLTTRLQRAMEATEDHGLRQKFAMAILNLDPTHEQACRTAMEAAVLQGEANEAYRLYNELWKELDREFDSEPSLPTQELVAKIKMGRFRVAAVPLPVHDVRLNLPEQIYGHHLHLMDFETQGQSDEQAAIVKIFRRDLMSALTRFRDWHVYDASEPAAVQHGGYKIGASTNADGSNIQFNVTICDATNGRVLWSERFKLQADTWYDAQRLVIRRIAVAFDVNLSSDRLHRVAAAPNVPLVAFEKWLLGQRALMKWDPKEEKKAENLFRAITLEAPNFAPAHAGLAGILNSHHLIFPGQYRTPVAQAEALAHARKAVEIDPLDSRSQLNLAWSHAMNNNFQKAVLNFRLAYELNENDPWTLVSAAEGLALCGDVATSESLIESAGSVCFGNSELYWSYLASTNFILGDMQSCIDASMRAGPLLNGLGAWQSAAHALLGNLDAARRCLAEFKSDIRANWAGTAEPTDYEISKWVLQIFPIANQHVKDQLCIGLESSGLPIEKVPTQTALDRPAPRPMSQSVH